MTEQNLRLLTVFYHPAQTSPRMIEERLAGVCAETLSTEIEDFLANGMSVRIARVGRLVRLDRASAQEPEQDAEWLGLTCIPVQNALAEKEKADA